jgi:hypothetical protein
MRLNSGLVVGLRLGVAPENYSRAIDMFPAALSVPEGNCAYP